MSGWGIVWRVLVAEAVFAVGWVGLGGSIPGAVAIAMAQTALLVIVFGTRETEPGERTVRLNAYTAQKLDELRELNKKLVGAKGDENTLIAVALREEIEKTQVLLQGMKKGE